MNTTKNEVPDEVTYTYGDAQMTVKLDVFRRNDVKNATRHIHVHEGVNTSDDHFRTGELIPVLVPDGIVDEFDAGCPSGPLAVMSTVNGIASSVRRGDILPVDRVNADPEGTGLYEDGLPVFHRERLKERWPRNERQHRYL